MQYREFGKTREQVSALGFGCMRLPVIDGQQDKIDEDKAIALIRHAIDHGVNYIDTAFPYHGTGSDRGGASEPLVGKALRDGYRARVKLATKLPIWFVNTRADMDKYLDRQLERLETDVIDFYLLHALNKSGWAKMKALGVCDFLDRAIKDGRIRYAGFSFHDNIACFKDIVDSYDWSFCQIQYNYLDENYQAGTEGLKYAAERRLGVTVMEPLRGGSLAGKLPDEVLKAIESAETPTNPARLALQWVMNAPEVSVTLSGMTAMSDLKENLETAEHSLPNAMTEEALELVALSRKSLGERMRVPCTGCRYCMPCPSGVDIPTLFSMYNTAHLFDAHEITKIRYGNLPKSAKAFNCVACGACESRCPQHISIPRELKKVCETFE
jgi:predicted aldo/keto reductase-like oxidoreductase